MPSSSFVDYIKIFLRSGKGGAGSAHLHREKFVAKGGPDGGDGGRGGHIILRGSRNVWTLLALRYQKHLFAGNGGCGGSAGSTGADGDDVIIEVPLGTVAKDAETEKDSFERRSWRFGKLELQIGDKSNTSLCTAWRTW